VRAHPRGFPLTALGQRATCRDDGDACEGQHRARWSRMDCPVAAERETRTASREERWEWHSDLRSERLEWRGSTKPRAKGVRAAMRGTCSSPPVNFADDEFRNCHPGEGRAAMRCIAWAKAERSEA
jgi:hypothetical protein